MKTAVRLLNLGLVLGLVSCTGGGGGGGSSSGGASYGALVNSRFVDAPVVGLQYYRSSETSDGLAADDVRTTGANGSFQCLTGETVTFSLNAINGVDLGQITCGAGEIFPNDLNTVNGDARKAQMIALLLHHLGDGFDGTTLISANSTIVISANAISFMSGYNVNLNDDVALMGIINEIRASSLLGTCSDPSFTNRAACFAAPSGVETWSISNLSNVDFDNMLLAAQAHLDESVEIVEEANQAGNFPVPTEQQLSDYIASHVSSTSRDTYDVDGVTVVLTEKCLSINDGNSGDNAFSLFINGTKYAHQDGIGAFEVCTVTYTNHPSFSVGDLSSTIENLETTNSGKLFLYGGNVRFAHSCPNANGVINGVCDTAAISP